MSRVVDLYEKAHAIPLVGDRLFSFAFAQVAPYFWTIRPRFTVIEPNHAEVVIPKRRGVKNHIGTVHAIALCNGLEAAMGVLAEAHPERQALDPQGDGGQLHRQGDHRHHLHRRDRPGAVDRRDPDVPVRVQGRAQGRHRGDRGRHPALGHREAVGVGQLRRRPQPRFHASRGPAVRIPRRAQSPFEVDREPGQPVVDQDEDQGDHEQHLDRVVEAAARSGCPGAAARCSRRARRPARCP